MNNNIIKLMLGLCLLLLIILWGEWKLIDASRKQLEELLSSSEEQQNQDRELPDLKLAKRSLDEYSEMTDRPLFIQGRRPVINDEDVSSQQEVGKIDDLLLLGIYSIKGQKTALFNQKAAEIKFLKKDEGDDISGWLLKEIQPDRVIMEQAGQQETVMLRKPKPKTAKKRKIAKKPKVVTGKPTKPRLVSRKPKIKTPEKQYD